MRHPYSDGDITFSDEIYVFFVVFLEFEAMVLINFIVKFSEIILTDLRS